MNVQKFLDDLIKLMNDKRGDFHLLDDLEVLPFAIPPACFEIFIPCDKQLRKPRKEDMFFEFDSFLQGNDLVCGAKCKGHKITITAKEGTTDHLVFVGQCPICQRRYIAAEQIFLMKVAYHAVFGLWPKY